jgi:hypothetical protein
LPAFPARSTDSKTGDAQRTIQSFFLFPAFHLGNSPGPVRNLFLTTFPPRIWHVPCWATLSKILASRGLKSRPGGLPCSCTAIDWRVSRPPSSVAAREAKTATPGQSTFFSKFFRKIPMWGNRRALRRARWRFGPRADGGQGGCRGR